VNDRPTGASVSSPDHAPIDDHGHVHDQWCGHPAIPHDDHVDYLHDGRVHRPCSDHVDELPDCEEPVHETHLPHSAHMHVHTADCGHPVVSHDDHVDYLHGRHRHASHQTHYDEH
jgi:hypothetical protein